MKKRFPLLFVIAILVCLCGCGSNNVPREETVVIGGTTFTVDRQEGIIRDAQYTYRVTSSGNRTTILYPNGGTYSWQEIGGYGTGSTTMDLSVSPYADPMTLLSVINARSSHSERGGHVGLGLVLLLLAVCMAVWPRAFWYLHTGWRFKDAEPSDLALGLNRTVGIILGIVGIIFLFV